MRGETLSQRSIRKACFIFQSTLPMRGETQVGNDAAILLAISIHSPHAGRDVVVACQEDPVSISIHSPHAGRDKPVIFINGINGISIHSPHAGRDDCKPDDVNRPIYFNPLSPCGERPDSTDWLQRCLIFQSTLPMRGETDLLVFRLECGDISIHSPHAGRDRSSKR